MIYFIQCGEDGFVKIGYTARNVQGRLNNLQTSCPYELRLIGMIPDGTELDEMSLHRRFASLMVRGEWFRLEGELTTLVASLGYDASARPTHRKASSKPLALRKAIGTSSVRKEHSDEEQVISRRHDDWLVAHEIGVPDFRTRQLKKRSVEAIAESYQVTPKAVRKGILDAKDMRRELAECVAEMRRA